MKKFFVFALVFVMALFCVGCTQGSGSVKKTYSSTFNSSEMSMAYDDFNGYRKREFELNGGNVINYEITSSQGAVTISIQNVQTEDYLLNKVVTTSVDGSVSVDISGKYLVTVYAEHHFGSFSVKINKE